MSRKIKADGDTWSVRLAEHEEDPETRTVLFLCITSNQRPYRVLEVPRASLPSERKLDALNESELKQLFRKSGSLGCPRGYPAYSS